MLKLIAFARKYGATITIDHDQHSDNIYYTFIYIKQNLGWHYTIKYADVVQTISSIDVEEMICDSALCYLEEQKFHDEQAVSSMRKN